MTATMLSVSTVSATDPLTATSHLARLCALTAPNSTDSTFRFMSAISSRYSRRVGILSKSASSKSEAISASLTSFQSIRKNATKSLLSTLLALRCTTDVCSVAGHVVLSLRKKSLPRTGARRFPVPMKPTRSQTKPPLHMSRLRLASPASGPV